jgi:hypothetical protein
MQKTILTVLAATLIAASTAQIAAATHKVTHARVTEQFRNANNAIAQPAQPYWPYSGWSVPAGR